MRAAQSQTDVDGASEDAATWLCAAMIEGWRGPRAQLLAELQARPGALELAAKLIWGSFSGSERRAMHSFRLCPRGALADPALIGPDGAALELEATQPIALLHPLELERHHKRAWIDALAGAGIEQPFAQLRRAVLRPTAEQSREGLLRRFAARPLRAPALDDPGCAWRAWRGPTPAAREGSPRRGYVLSLRRGPVHMLAVAILDPNTHTLVELFDAHGQALTQLHPVLVSELLCQLEALATLPFAQLQLSLAAHAPASDAPPTSCLGCGAVLEASVRVLELWRAGLGEAPGSAPTRRRCAAHWTCIENLAELQLAAAQLDVRGTLLELCRTHTDKPPEPARAQPELDEDELLALCSDQRSIRAAKQAARPSSWTLRGRAGELAWGNYSGRRAYRVAVDLGRGLARCECQSRKRPCKHGVALMLLGARGQLGATDPPSWARARFPDAVEAF